MTGQLLPFPAGRCRPRASVTRVGAAREAVRLIVGCRCGFSRTITVAAEASRVKRAHDAEHRRAEDAHPAGKALPGAGGAS